MIIGGYRYRADIGGSVGLIRESGPAGRKEYPIVHVLGGKYVYYFLTRLERGRLQVLPLAYDVRSRQWYDTAASALRHFQDIAEAPYHWQDWPYTFNTACYNCHVSQVSSNYDPQRDTYHTVWAEPGINCETCHGPAAAHLQVVQEARQVGVADVGIISLRKFSPEQINDLCGSCHAKLLVLTTNYVPGSRFFDHYDLATIESPDFYPDGRDLGENYTYAQWRRSLCVQRGRLSCLHCHTSSGRLRFHEDELNNACAPCHQARIESVAAHSHHQPASKGNRCVSCHMPTTVFARMRRSDHSMKPPTPAATLTFGSPNACNLCHTDKDAAWADRTVRQWHTNDYQKPVLDLTALIDAARKQNWSQLPAMLAYLRRSDRDEVFANSLVRLIRYAAHPEVRQLLTELLQDRSPLIRASAADAFTHQAGPETVSLLARATHDDYRLVRVRAAAALAGAPPEAIPPSDQPAVNRAIEEYLNLLHARPDDALSHYNLAGFYVQRGEHGKALESYQAAIRLQPDHVPSLVNVSLVYNERGQNELAESVLRQALKYQPTNAAVNFNLGLLLGELGRANEAEAALRIAFKSEPTASAAYNLGVLLAQRGRLADAAQWCREAVRLAPANAKYSYALALYLSQQGDAQAAIEVLETLSKAGTDHGDAVSLLASLYEKQGRLKEAIALCQQAASNVRLPEQTRAALSRRAEELRKLSR
jgi:tetratricopeptide (TPR) repeat protein